jgi:hypothetical protein
MAGQMVTFTYAASHATPPYVFIVALDNKGGDLGYSVGDHSAIGFSLYTVTAPVNGTAYSVWYWVVA